MKKFLMANNEQWTVLLRVTLGLVLFLHGAQKGLGLAGGAGWAAAVARMSGRGIPELVAHLVIIGELFGGLALVAGFLTRFAAGGNAIIMAGAVFLVHWRGGFFAQKGGFEFPLVLLVLALFFAVRGAGRYSVDALLFGRSA